MIALTLLIKYQKILCIMYVFYNEEKQINYNKQ